MGPARLTDRRYPLLRVLNFPPILTFYHEKTTVNRLGKLRWKNARLRNGGGGVRPPPPVKELQPAEPRLASSGSPGRGSRWQIRWAAAAPLQAVCVPLKLQLPSPHVPVSPCSRHILPAAASSLTPYYPQPYLLAFLAIKMRAYPVPTLCTPHRLPVLQPPPESRSVTSRSYRLRQPWRNSADCLLLEVIFGDFFSDFFGGVLVAIYSRTGYPASPARLMRSGITRKWRRKRWGSSFKFVRANPAAPGHAGNAGCLHSCQYRLQPPLGFPNTFAHAQLLLPPNSAQCTCAELSLFAALPSLPLVAILPLFLARACSSFTQPRRWRVGVECGPEGPQMTLSVHRHLV